MDISDIILVDGFAMLWADIMDISSLSALHLFEFSTWAETLEDGLSELTNEAMYDEGIEGGRNTGDGGKKL